MTNQTPKINTVGSQKGPQEMFMSSAADIAIYGGSAGGGKSWALLFEGVRHIKNSRYGAVIFRRTSPMITNEGGLWDESKEIYGRVDGVQPTVGRLEWKFRSGSKIRFSHLEHEKNVDDWYGSQITYIGFDQLEQFTEKQFWGMVSRNRSTCGVKPYLRATCNPDPDSFLAEFLEWWIDTETGYPIKERAGIIRWMLRSNDTIYWYDTYENALSNRGHLSLDDDVEPKSVTFIPASLQDNKILMAADPGYLANLNALPLIERERLKEGNWKIKAGGGNVFNMDWFETVESAPANVSRSIRYWDRAATEPSAANKNPDWTVGLKMSVANDVYYIEDVQRDRFRPFGVEELIRRTAELDGPEVEIGIEQDPGQAGKVEANYHITKLAGYIVKAYPVTKSKLVRAKALSAQVEARNVKLVKGPWVKSLISEYHGFPDTDKDDQVDAGSGAFNALTDSGELTSQLFW